MARILYLMHVDWRWIRQRPQELAVGLVESGHDVRVLFTPQFQTGTPAVPRSGDSQVKRSALWSLPLRRFSPVRRINRAVQKWQVTLACRRSRPDHVWITAPELLQLVPERQHSLIYDCMDLAEGFGETREAREAIRDAEAATCRRAALVLCSSQALRDHLAREYGCEPLVVRNAHWQARAELSDDPGPRREGLCRLLYVGTIAGWFDFELCAAVLADRPDLEIHLAGPLAVELPDVPRLVHLGVRDRNDLPALAAGYDGLVMPFIVSDLVRAVDPVKLYEYISMRRPVLAVDYPELAPYAGLLTTYSTRRKFEDWVDRIQADPARLLPPRSAAREFLRDNTWAVRCRQIDDRLASLSSEGSQPRRANVDQGASTPHDSVPRAGS